MKIRAVLLASAAAVALLAGCASTVSGSGSVVAGSVPTGGVDGGSSADFPSGAGSGVATPTVPSGSVPSETVPPESVPPSESVPSGSAGSATSTVAPPTGCPSVVYPAAKLSFSCFASDLTQTSADPVWPLAYYKVVEASTEWSVEEGSGHWGSPGSDSLADIIGNVRSQMVNQNAYGTSPKVTTVSDKAATVDGHTAQIVQTTMTLNAAWAAKDKTKVKQEHLWIVAVDVAPNDVSLWFVTIPDLDKAEWSKVPSLIASIKVD
jgi:hypothetical protein